MRGFFVIPIKPSLFADFLFRWLHIAYLRRADADGHAHLSEAEKLPIGM